MNIAAEKAEKTEIVPYLYLLGKVMLVIVLARTQAASVYPFGIAYAAALAEENIIAAAVGLVIGAAVSAETAVKYILTAAVYGAMVYIRKFEEGQVKAIALGASLLLASLVSVFTFGVTPSKLLIMLPEAFAAGGLYLLFAGAKNRRIAAFAAETVLMGAFLSGIYGIRLPYLDINIAVFLAMMIVMSTSYSCGVPTAVLTGAILGFMTFLNRETAVEMSGLFAISALLGALLAKMGRGGVAAGFLTGATVCVLCMGRLGELSIADILAAPIIFLIIPQKLAVKTGNRINSNFAGIDYGGEFNSRVKSVAKAVEDLGSGVMLLSKSKSSEGGACADTARKACKDCKNAERCFADGGKMMEGYAEKLRDIAEKDGYLNFSNIPREFGRFCVRQEKFLNEFSHMLEMEKQKAILEGELVSDRELVAKQYGEISNIISNLSERKEKGDREEKYSVSVSVCQEAKKGQEINGDTVIHFKKGNKYYVILCDGMGSGAAAREISGLTARLFAEFFESGIDKSAAVEMINSALALNVDRESFSSADIFEIDLSSGEAEFLKIGSAQSFIKRKSEIEAVTSSALPIGILEKIEVTPQKYSLSAGDEILMITDGIGEATSGVLKNEWIKKVFASAKGNGKETAELLLEGARARSVFSDDKTGVIIKIKNKED